MRNILSYIKAVFTSHPWYIIAAVYGSAIFITAVLFNAMFETDEVSLGMNLYLVVNTMLFPIVYFSWENFKPKLFKRKILPDRIPVPLFVVVRTCKFTLLFMFAIPLFLIIILQLIF